MGACELGWLDVDVSCMGSSVVDPLVCICVRGVDISACVRIRYIGVIERALGSPQALVRIITPGYSTYLIW